VQQEAIETYDTWPKETLLAVYVIQSPTRILRLSDKQAANGVDE